MASLPPGLKTLLESFLTELRDEDDTDSAELAQMRVKERDMVAAQARRREEIASIERLLGPSGESESGPGGPPGGGGL